MLLCLLNFLFQPKELFFHQYCAVHFPATLQQIVCLIHQKKVIPRYSFTKKTFQINMRIKHIVIISNDAIRKKTHVQTEFKGTDVVFSGIFLNNFSCEALGVQKKIIYRVINPVKVSLCVRTMIRITFHLFHKTYFFLCCQHHALKLQSMLTKQ